VRYLDTFEWLLYHAGHSLRQEGHLWQLHLPETSAAPLETTTRARRRPRFWWEFPAGPFRNALASLIDLRALLPIMELTEECTTWRLTNKDDKTVVRLRLTRVESGAGDDLKRGILVDILPLRGYDKAAERLHAALAEINGLKPTASPFAALLTLTGTTPSTYTAKPALPLVPDLPAAEAVKIILRQLLLIIRANVPGIIADIDTEFLHDFRVAVRRTRAALGQMKGVFAPDSSEHFRREFANLGRLTNRLRDLDVYLLNENTFRTRLPEGLRPGLDPLFQRLARQRRTELRRLRAAFAGPDFDRLCGAWEAFLAAPLPADDASAPNQQRPIRQLSAHFIRRRYRRIITAGGKITPKSPADDLHQLRIQCKKLRYLLEFFAVLFPPAEMKQLIKQLKQLQDNLGEFNDLNVQQRYLQQYLNGLKPTAADVIQQAAALGGLLTDMNTRQRRVRDDFAAAFAAFSGTETTALFRQLFD
jgi:CHAD domain-containing protein